MLWAGAAAAIDQGYGRHTRFEVGATANGQPRRGSAMSAPTIFSRGRPGRSQGAV